MMIIWQYISYTRFDVEKIIKATFRIPHETMHNLKIHCATREISISTIVNMAIKQYLHKYDEKIKTLKNSSHPRTTAPL